MAIALATWLPHERLIVSQLNGSTLLVDVERWQASLAEALDQIPAHTTFKMLADTYGYESGELAAHKAMRTVIPLTLAHYGYRTALFDLFDPVDMPLTTTRGITCVAIAHVNHDAEKMAEYERAVGRTNERFFTSVANAEAWLRGIE